MNASKVWIVRGKLWAASYGLLRCGALEVDEKLGTRGKVRPSWKNRR